MTVYAWREGGRFPVPAQKAGEELERIREENGGQVTPRKVVEESKPTEAPLHPCFEWNNKRAAELYRDEQARCVVRSVRIIPEPDQAGKQDPVLAYVRVKVKDEEEKTQSFYMSTAHVMSDQELRKQAIKECLALLNGIQRRYDHLKELREIWRAIERLGEDFGEE
jgi:hypothetical protein